MKHYLSIVIPRYQETEKDIFPLLSGIAGQLGVDFSEIEVIIVNDGGGPGELDRDFLALFHMNIRQVNLQNNGGPGVARQAGLDTASGEYVLFCDADDTLQNVGALGALLEEAKQNAPDILNSAWIEEYKNQDGQLRYLTHENENIWMHGKLLRRQFLQKNDIHFHPELRAHEDSYFLCIAAAAAERRGYLPIPTYVWKYHPESITRRNGASYTYESAPTFIRACSMANREVERINPGLMEYKILQFTLYNYFCFHQPGWQAPEHAEQLRVSETAFREHMEGFWHYWQNAAPENRAAVYNQERERVFRGCVENETVAQWISRLGLEA